MSGRLGVDTTAEDAVLVGAGSDTVVYNPPLRGLFVGTGGAVAVVTAAGNAVTITCANNAIIPVACSQVKQTNTTASNIAGLRS